MVDLVSVDSIQLDDSVEEPRPTLLCGARASPDGERGRLSRHLIEATNNQPRAASGQSLTGSQPFPSVHSQRMFSKKMSDRDKDPSPIDMRAAQAPSEIEAPMAVKVVSALGGALLTSLLMTPFDVVKTRLQAQLPSSVKCEVNLSPTECPRCSHYIRFNGLQDFPVEKARGDPFIKKLAEKDGSTAAKQVKCRSSHLNVPHYRGTVDAFAKIVRNEGVGALYNGLAPTLVLSLPSTVIYYVLYDELSKKLTVGGLDKDVAAVSSGMGAR